MPTVSVSIRNEDYDKWRALSSPAEFIHNALQADGLSVPEHIVKTLTSPGVVKAEPVLKAEPLVPRPPDPETGYPCCTKAKPCKHWQWDELESVWRNELTGKVREI